jgi:signal transduction histidine kinase
VARQLAFITELEHDETDPEVLANLFRLDHLATRLRRHADSLLVMAGGEPVRRWSTPVSITDAVRAALGEIEDYQRVTLRQLEPAAIHGGAAADLAHLLAELIENGLTYSPPDRTVEIRGRCQMVQRTVAPHAPAALHGGLAMGYTLAVIDRGVGMRPAEVDRANRRLAGAESFTIAPSKYLGHYVAGKLAARQGITVTLHSAAFDDLAATGPRATGSGVTATIGIPAELVAAGSPHIGDVRATRGTDPAPALSPSLPPIPPLPEASRTTA